MDNAAQISELVDQLGDNLDSLQTAVKSLINKSLTDVAADYPVLERAKLYILMTYAIESAIFSFLRLTGTSAREHPVFRELERVKQYFQKAKLAETSVLKPVMRLDQAAAGRFIKAALAGNDTPRPQVKVDVDHKPVKGTPEAIPPGSTSKKRKLDDVSKTSLQSPIRPPISESSDEDSDEDDHAQAGTAESSKPVSPAVTPSKGVSKSSTVDTMSMAETEPQKRLSKSERRKLRKAEKKRASEEAAPMNGPESVEPQQKKIKTNEDRKRSKGKKKKDKDRKSAG